LDGAIRGGWPAFVGGGGDDGGDGHGVAADSSHRRTKGSSGVGASSTGMGGVGGRRAR